MNDSMPPPDHVREDLGDSSDADVRIADNVKSWSTWQRLLFMILFFALWSISRVVVFAVVVLQFLCVLFSGNANERLRRLGHGLATYSYQIVLYLTFGTEEQPFPFSNWPDGPPGQESEETTSS